MDIRIEAAERILNRGVRFRLPAPFFSRLLKRNTIVVHPPYGGTILEFSRIVLKHKLEDAIALSDYAALEKSISPVALCVAISILNDKHKIAEQADELAEKLLWKVKPRLLIEIFLTIERMNLREDFMTITRYYVIQTSMMMNPNLGQEENGR